MGDCHRFEKQIPISTLTGVVLLGEEIPFHGRFKVR